MVPWANMSHIADSVLISSATFAGLMVVKDRETNRETDTTCFNRPCLASAAMHEN